MRFQVLLGEQKVATLDFPEVRVNDGEWHHLLVELRSSKDGKDTKYMANVYLDYDMFMVSSVVLTKQNKKNRAKTSLLKSSMLYRSQQRSETSCLDSS